MNVRIHVEHLEVWYAQRLLEKLPRLRGEKKHRIDYRHIIDWLARKPGAFAHYRYREDLFPTSRFRMAYDALKSQGESRAEKDYLRVLELAAKEGESRVEAALGLLLRTEQPIRFEALKERVSAGQEPPPVTDVKILPVDLRSYDRLLEGKEVAG